MSHLQFLRAILPCSDLAKVNIKFAPTYLPLLRIFSKSPVPVKASAAAIVEEGRLLEGWLLTPHLSTAYEV